MFSSLEVSLCFFPHLFWWDDIDSRGASLMSTRWQITRQDTWAFVVLSIFLMVLLFSIFRNYMNDSLRTDVFLRYPPETIACACVQLSANLLQVMYEAGRI